MKGFANCISKFTFSLYCFIYGAFPEVDKVLGASRKLIGIFNHSSQLCDRLRQVQNAGKMGKKAALNLVNDVKTRMSSTEMSLERLITLEEYIDRLVEDGDLDEEKNLTAEEWNLLRGIQKVLEPLRAAQRMLEGDQYPTGSILLGLITDLRRKLQHLVQVTAPNIHGLHGNEIFTFIHEQLKRMLADFEERWGDGKDVLTQRLGKNNRPFGITKVRSCFSSQSSFAVSVSQPALTFSTVPAVRNRSGLAHKGLLRAL